LLSAHLNSWRRSDVVNELISRAPTSDDLQPALRTRRAKPRTLGHPILGGNERLGGFAISTMVGMDS
jgi:hypothetical protein